MFLQGREVHIFWLDVQSQIQNMYGKVCIHLAKNKEISPNFFFLKNYIKVAYATEKYKATVDC